MKICPKCKSKHNKNGTFCSRSCANSRTWNFHDKEKKSIANKKICSIRFIECLDCSSIFYIKRRGNPTNRYCPLCLSKRRSNNAYKALSIRKNSKRSKLEIELFNLCTLHFNKVDHNLLLVGPWDADIVIHDIKTAILWNGPWHYQEMPGLNHSLKQTQNRDKIKINELHKAGWIVKVFEDRLYTPSQALNELLQLSI